MGEGTITEEKNYQRGFMRSLFDNIQSLIILILIIIILLMRACDGGGNQIDIDEDTNIIRVDTILKVDTVEVEKEVYNIIYLSTVSTTSMITSKVENVNSSAMIVAFVSFILHHEAHLPNTVY